LKVFVLDEETLDILALILAVTAKLSVFPQKLLDARNQFQFFLG